MIINKYAFINTYKWVWVLSNSFYIHVKLCLLMGRCQLVDGANTCGSLRLAWYPLVYKGTGSLGNDGFLLGPPGADPGTQGHPNSQSQAQMIQKLRSNWQKCKVWWLFSNTWLLPGLGRCLGLTPRPATNKLWPGHMALNLCGPQFYHL